MGGRGAVPSVGQLILLVAGGIGPTYAPLAPQADCRERPGLGCAAALAGEAGSCAPTASAAGRSEYGATPMAEEGLQLKRYGELAELVLARPERQNAINRAMWQALAHHCDEMERDPALRVVVVRGEGAAFSAGADIAEFEQVFADRHTAHDYDELVQQAIGRLERLGKPTIAAIGGNCVGGGCALAAACDLRFA